MRAIAAGLGRARHDGLLWAPTERRPKGTVTFAQAGYSFIPLRQAHLNFMAAIYGRWVLPLEECTGRTLVDHEYLPLGVLLVHHEPSGRRMLMAHFGRFLREFPVACLRSIKEVCDILQARELYELHCTADETVKGSEKLVRWLNGVPVEPEERDDFGRLWVIDMHRTPI